MILNGWKEVANYMGRGVRTVQRWEKLGLPVHRPNIRLRSAVVTTSEELDKWLAECANGRTAMFFAASDAPQVKADIGDEMAKTSALITQLHQLCESSRKMRAEMSAVRSRTQQLRVRFEACHTAHAALQKTAKWMIRTA